MRRGLRGCAWLAIGGASILLTAWLTLQWGILPHLGHWRPQLEAQASTWLDRPVRIGAIEASSDLWAPSVTLHDLQLLDDSGQAALRLARLDARLVPGSLLPRSLSHWEPTFAELALDQLTLEVRRRHDGRLRIAGFELPEPTASSPSPDDSPPPPALSWLLRQGALRLTEARIHWIDEAGDPAAQTGTPVRLSLHSLNLSLQRQRLSHELQFDAPVPAEWRGTGGEPAARLRLQARWSRPLLAGGHLVAAADWRHWRGQATLQLPPIALAPVAQVLGAPLDRWLTAQPGQPRPPRSGQLALQAELAWKDGQLRTLQADTDLQALELPWHGATPPLRLARLQTRLALEHVDPSLKLRFDPLRWHDDPHTPAPPATALTLQFDPGPSTTESGTRLSASGIDLAALARLGGMLPLAESSRQLIAELAPQGQLQRLDARWQLSSGALQSYQASGQIEQLGLKAQSLTARQLAEAQPGRPGLSHARLDFRLDQHGGQGRLRIEHGSLDLPGIFAEPLVPLDQLDLPLRWSVEPHAGTPPTIEVQLQGGRLAHADAAGELSGRWRSGAGTHRYPGLLTLDVHLNRADATRVHRYLPLALSAATRQYVRDAVQAGRSGRVVARVEGDLRDFPFSRPGSGEFRIEAEIDAGRLAYVPAEPGRPLEWPLLTDVHGTLIFAGNSMRVQDASARVGELGSGSYRLDGVQGGIADFGQPTLQIGGQGSGPLADLLAYCNTSPVSGWIGDALQQARSSGTGALQLDLQLPLDDLVHSRVQGQVRLAGNELQLRPDVPALAELAGTVAFSESGFQIEHASASALGGALSFGGGLGADGRLRFSGNGHATAAGLRSAPGVPSFLLPLAAQLRGSADYTLELEFTDGLPQVTVHSPLVGMAAAWPAPLGKQAVQRMPMSVRLQTRAEHPGAGHGGAGTDIADWHIRLADLLDLQLRLDQNASGTVLRHGGVGLGHAAPAGQTGLTVALHWPAIDVDEWRRWYQQLDLPSPAATPADHPAGSPTAADSPALPLQIEIDTPQLRSQGFSLTGLRASVQHDPAIAPTGWLARVQADQLAGQLQIDLPPAAPMRLQAHLSRLSLPDGPTVATDLPGNSPDRLPLPADASAATTPPRPRTAAGSPAVSPDQPLPELDVRIDDLRWRQHALGRLELLAGPVHAAAAGAPPPNASTAWQIRQLSLDNPDARLDLSGQWYPGADRDAGSTILDWRLALHDGGGLLDRLGRPQLLSGAKGTLQGQLHWPGQPWALNADVLSGQASIALGSGQVLQVETGPVRLLGLLTLQSLPRRLLLDFSDLTQAGFSFDRIDGHLRIDDGIARTSDLRVQSVMATVETSGSADLASARQNLRVRVLPDLNAGAASLAYAAINPALGLGTLVGQWVLQKPLANAVAREFSITGSFADPQVTPIDHPTAAPPPTPPAAPRSTPTEPRQP